MIQTEDYLSVPLDRTYRQIEDVPGAFYEMRRKAWLVPKHSITDLVDVVPSLTEQHYILETLRQERELREQVAKFKVMQDYDIEVPGLKATLDPYQKVDLALALYVKKLLVAWDVGLGKTIESVAMALMLKDKITNVLILCESSAKFDTWQREIEKFSDESVIVVDGNKQQRLEQWNTKSFFHVANYELVFHDWPQVCKGWGLIVLDEANRIQSYDARTSNLVKELRSEYALALTATPQENKIEELHSIIEFLDPTAFGSRYQFANVVRGIRRNPDSVQSKKDMERIWERLSLRMTRRLNENTMQLPPKLYEDRFVRLTSDQRNHYISAANDFAGWLIAQGEDVRTNIAIKKLTRLKQIADSLELVGVESTASSKLEEIRIIVADVVNRGEKVILFTQYEKMASLIKRELPFESSILSGKIKGQKRKEAIESFRNDPNIHVFISTDAGSRSLNLQVATWVIHVDYLWNPAKMRVQREGRSRRRGQENAVHIVNLKAQGTIDEYIEEVLKRKTEDARITVEGADAALFRRLKLSKEDLLELARTDKL